MNELLRKMESFAYANGKDTKQVMADLLRFIVFNFCFEPEPIPTWKYTKEQNQEFCEMMALYISAMENELRSKEWYDMWGDLFMWLTPKGGAKGQFFTPANVCDMMAQSIVDTTTEPDKFCGAFGMRVVIGDPAAGSARNLLAAHAMFVRDEARKPYLVAEDIDPVCCLMSAVNMMVHGCFGEVICHNTLTDPKGLAFGFLINEGLYPIPAMPTIRIKHEPEWFVSLRPQSHSRLS